MDNRRLVYSTLRQYEISNDQKSMGIFIFTILALIISVLASAYGFQQRPYLSVILIIPSAILLCRMFVLQHDCGHQSFFTYHTINTLAGAILGFLTMIPSALWNQIHNTHHGLVGNLSKRKENPELWTLTVDEYKQSSRINKLAYRIMRSIPMRLFVTPLMWILAPRIPFPHLGTRIISSIILHDIVYAFILYYIISAGHFEAFVVVYMIPLYLFNFLASIFFYLQHQYEDTSWTEKEDWDLFNASIHGSSHLIVGKFLAWVSGNVGCHHVHHLNTRIPSYQLENATQDVNRILDVEPIYLKELFRHLNCTLWDEKRGKLVSIKSISRY